MKVTQMSETKVAPAMKAPLKAWYRDEWFGEGRRFEVKPLDKHAASRLREMLAAAPRFYLLSATPLNTSFDGF